MGRFFYLLKEGFRGLWKNRTMSLASIAVLISCLLLTGMAVMLSLNLSSTMESIEGNNQITIFLSDGLPQITAIQVGEKIRANENVADCTFIARDDALADVMEALGDDGSILNGLDGEDNFLPDSYKISMKDLGKYDATIEEISAIEGVDHITDYSNIANKLSNLDKLFKYASLAFIVVLGIVSLFIISNTVRVTMFTRRVEISIMKSVGATNWFVRVPFIVEGFLIGIISGGISVAVLLLAYSKLTEVVYSVVPFLTVFNIDPYTWYIVGTYLLAGALFGVIGGLFSLGRYLKKEGEDAIL
ncbi:MAG: permease-like cell division protein FtsX [Clostridia bacterium]|nr:permease-like cell division protein FtsX [Clostridia bacterium]